MASCSLTMQSELHSFMEVLLKAIVYEVSEVFRDGMADSEEQRQHKLRGVSQILVRRAVVKITQCVEDSVGTEMARLKEENERLKVRLQLWEKEPGAGGDRGQTDRDGHTPPCEITAEIKEETDTEPELSATEGPLDHQCSEEEWDYRLRRYTELTAAEGKETLSEQQHPESRQRVEDLDSVPVMKTEPESETPGLLVSDGCTGNLNNLDTKSIAELESLCLNGLKKEELTDVDVSITAQYAVSQTIHPPEEQPTDTAGRENSTKFQRPDEIQDREESPPDQGAGKNQPGPPPR